MKIFIILVVIAILIIGSFFIYRGSYKKAGQSSNNNVNSEISSNGNSNSAEADSVTISNFSFNPATITVEANYDITFTNNDSTTHTITENNGKFDQTISPGKTATIKIAEPGTYSYHCKIHPSMKGTIIVQ